MTEKKFYVAPEFKVHQIKVEHQILVTSDPQPQSIEEYEEGSTQGWF